MVSVVAATYCGYFVSNKLCIAVFCFIRPFQPQFWSWSLYFYCYEPIFNFQESHRSKKKEEITSNGFE